MLRSLELRWFIKGILPTDIYKWFTDILPGNETFEEKPRSDYYLPTQSDDLGIKFSRQQLQVKIRKDKVNLGFDWFLNNETPESFIIDDYITNNETFNKTIKEIFNQYTDYKITKTPNSFGYPYFFIKDLKRKKIPISNVIMVS